MFQKLECVCIYTADLAASLVFYTSMGLVEAWRIERLSDARVKSSLVGLKFPRADSSELVLSDNADIQVTDIEIHVDDVRATHATLAGNDRIEWIRAPFATESGHVAVMAAPDKNVFVLVGR